MMILRDPNRRPPPMHPGEILREEFMVPLGTTNQQLADALDVPVETISNIVAERSGLND
jgi:addiction module HigA family antidote